MIFYILEKKISRSCNTAKICWMKWTKSGGEKLVERGAGAGCCVVG